MKLRRVDWRTFRLPFVTPFSTAQTTSVFREGLILRLVTDNGLIGLGEASPVATFGGGTLSDSLSFLHSVAPQLVGSHLEQIEIQIPHPNEPARTRHLAALCCAIDTAVLDIRAQSDGVPLARLLGGEPNRAVPVNATLGSLALSRTEAEHEVAMAARAVVEAGFECLKLKVGTAGSSKVEIDRVRKVRDAIGPGVRLRLDANGAWSVEEAVAIIQELERFDLELVEQPVAADDLDGMARVRAAVTSPIAADESVGDPDQAARVVAAGAADVLVVKPMLAGGPRPAREIIKLAEAAGLSVIVTTTIDAGVAVAAAIHVAAGLPRPTLACGLATGRLLAGDLISSPLEVHKGTMRPPAAPGLGVALDEHQLSQYGGSWQEVS